MTGFGSPAFEKCIRKIHDVHQKFAREVPANSLDLWVPADFEGHPSIAISNRFYSDRRSCGPSSDAEEVAFGEGVDPNRVLEKAKGKNLVHLTENEVAYFEWRDGR